ncbi:MAG: hypothetical protein ACK4P3_04145 [Fimbriimonadaceae bacterium]
MNKTVLIILIIVGALCLICGGGGAISWFVFRDQLDGPMQCGVTLGAAHTALVRYAEKNGTLPNEKNWQLALAEFMPRDGIDFMGMRVPSADEVWICNPSNPETGIAFNSDLSEVKWEQLTNRSVILFELPKSGLNQSMPYKMLSFDDSPKVGPNPRGWFVVTKVGVESAQSVPQ